MAHSGDTPGQRRDPFAPPPAGAPDQPWRPRGASGSPEDGGNGERPEQPGPGAPEDGAPRPPQAPQPPKAPHPAPAPERGHAHVPPPHPWSPGYQGQQPRFPYPPPQPPRFDPSDPVQRRARYALLAGMWSIFFFILGVPYVTLLLAALGVYWGVSSLRGKAKTPTSALTGGAPAPGQAPQIPQVQQVPQGPVAGQFYPVPPTEFKPQAPAATGGLIAGVLGLVLVAVVFGLQMYYKSFYDCQAQAPTKAASNACATTVNPRPPHWLVQLNAG